jgi:HEAT repeat protein
MLENERAFIYIDNVLLPDKVEQGRDALIQLLPKDMRNAKKLRLLLTARDKDAVRISGVKSEFYPIEILPEPEAVKLFKKTLDDNEKQLKPSQMNEIVKICGGVPKLLTVVAGFINS